MQPSAKRRISAPEGRESVAQGAGKRTLSIDRSAGVSAGVAGVKEALRELVIIAASVSIRAPWAALRKYSPVDGNRPECGLWRMQPAIYRPLYRCPRYAGQDTRDVQQHRARKALVLPALPAHTQCGIALSAGT